MGASGSVLLYVRDAYRQTQQAAWMPISTFMALMCKAELPEETPRCSGVDWHYWHFYTRNYYYIISSEAKQKACESAYELGKLCDCVQVHTYCLRVFQRRMESNIC